MTVQELLAVWEGGVLVVFLIIGCVYFRADYGIDKFRQEMFAVRDDLFDYAARGEISFNHPAYIQLRNLANGLIRFAHRMTLWRILAMFALCWLFGLHRPPTFDAELERNIASIGSAGVQQTLRGFHRRIALLMVWQLIRSSVFYWLLIVFAFCRHSLGAARIQIARVMRETAESPAVQRTIPTDWIEEQAVACV